MGSWGNCVGHRGNSQCKESPKAGTSQDCYGGCIWMPLAVMLNADQMMPSVKAGRSSHRSHQGERLCSLDQGGSSECDVKPSDSGYAVFPNRANSFVSILNVGC